MGVHKVKYVPASLLYDDLITGRRVFDPRKETDAQGKTWLVCPVCDHVFETDKQFAGHVKKATMGRSSPYCCADKQKRPPKNYVPVPKDEKKAEASSSGVEESSDESFVHASSLDSVDSDVTDEAKTRKRLHKELEDVDVMDEPVQKKQRVEEPVAPKVDQPQTKSRIRPSLPPRKAKPNPEPSLGQNWVQWLSEAVDTVLVKVNASQQEREATFTQRMDPAKKKERDMIDKVMADGASALATMDEKIRQNQLILQELKRKHREDDEVLEKQLRVYREQTLLSYEEREKQAEVAMKQKRLFELYIEERNKVQERNLTLGKQVFELLENRKVIQAYLDAQPPVSIDERELAESKVEHSRFRACAKQMLERFKEDFFPAPTVIMNFAEDGGPVQEEDTMAFQMVEH